MSDSIHNETQSNNTPTEFEEDGVYVALTHDTLNAVAIMDKVRSPKAGAVVLFAGTL
jgi:molybdopterin synthase catalytic subunit